jgi:hypothetical protein
MKLVHFNRCDHKGTIALVAKKIVGFTMHESDPNETSIFVTAPELCDEFIVGESYRQVNSIMENLKEDD